MRSSREAADGTGDGPSAAELACPGLARALERILADREQPEVLVLGKSCAPAAVYLADRGARVCVDGIQVPDPPARSDEESPDDEEEPAPIVISQPDGKYDLVLAWDRGDFIPPERLGDFGSEVGRILAPGGWLLFFAQDSSKGAAMQQDRPGRYRLTADDRMVRTVGEQPEKPRWAHPNREIERALAPLDVQSIHLQKDRVREFLMRKPGGGAKKVRQPPREERAPKPRPRRNSPRT